MRQHHRLADKRHRRIAGIGLVALDVVTEMGDPKPRLFAGGTVGNVHAILSHLGWMATPITRLDDSVPAQLVKADLGRWDVDTSLLTLSPEAKTPVIFQRVRRDRDDVPFHTFSFHCPGCGRRFPGFQPVTANAIESAKRVVAAADVFFVDRVSKSALILADEAIRGGTFLIFEPASSDGSKAFAKMVEMAHVVKYAHDRLDELSVSRGATRPLVEIQTLGRGGLRFRTRLSGMDRRWRHMQAEPVRNLRDAAGSGDWLSAGFIYALGAGSKKLSEDLTHDRLIRALSVGQRLAAWNCEFLGARGGMYSTRVPEIVKLVREGVGDTSAIVRPDETPLEDLVSSQVCANCNGATDHHDVPRRASYRTKAL